MIPNIIFIIPYRNRPGQKTHFNIYMKYLLEDKDPNSYKIFFIHQCDNRPFNRGAMKNIGFLVVRNLYPNDYKNINLVFNDVDTLPASKNLISYETNEGTIKHYYGFTFALGGIFSIKGIDFEKCGGFPNFWGWGYEDNCIHKRALQKNLKIDRSQFYPICNQNILHVLDGLIRSVTKTDKNMELNSNDNFNNLRNLKYNIVDDLINVTNFNTPIKCDANLFYEKNLLNKNTNNKNQKRYFNLQNSFTNNKSVPINNINNIKYQSNNSINPNMTFLKKNISTKNIGTKNIKMKL